MEQLIETLPVTVVVATDAAIAIDQDQFAAVSDIREQISRGVRSRRVAQSEMETLGDQRPNGLRGPRQQRPPIGIYPVLGGVPIVVPKEIRTDLERCVMSLAFKELSAESALDLLLALAGADYTWETKDGKIMIVQK